MENNSYLTVTALTKYIKYKFDHDVHLENVLLKGEISNFKHHSRGHFYFSLKDELTEIKAIMFSEEASKIDFEIKDGMKILVTGRVSVYEASGTYQIYVTSIKQDGIGELFIAYEKLKKELFEKGLFDEAHKKPIPKYPKAIGVVTSSTGAAIKDIYNIISNRFPFVSLILYPALVQGEFAGEDIVKQIKKANKDKLVDVLIVGRGGGSIEDLWCFNLPEVAYAIYDSEIPIISAVGHEIDFTISDYVADLRAPTPTGAALLATPDKKECLKNIDSLGKNLSLSFSKLLSTFNEGVTFLNKKLTLLSPASKLEFSRGKLIQQNERLNRHFERLLVNKSARTKSLDQSLLAFGKSPYLNILLDSIKKNELALERNFSDCVLRKKNSLGLNIDKLETLNPLSVMKKGYSIIYSNERIVKSKNDVKINDEISIALFDGNIKAVVKEK